MKKIYLVSVPKVVPLEDYGTCIKVQAEAIRLLEDKLNEVITELFRRGQPKPKNKGKASPQSRRATGITHEWLP